MMRNQEVLSVPGDLSPPRKVRENQRAGATVPLIPPMRLLRLLMIQADCERIPVDGERQGWTLDAVVPGLRRP